MNLLPAQRNMGPWTCAEESFLLCDLQVSKEVPQPDMPKFAPAMVSDRIDIGFMIKYMLKFDDGVVSGHSACLVL